MEYKRIFSSPVRSCLDSVRKLTGCLFTIIFVEKLVDNAKLLVSDVNKYSIHVIRSRWASELKLAGCLFSRYFLYIFLDKVMLEYAGWLFSQNNLGKRYDNFCLFIPSSIRSC